MSTVLGRPGKAPDPFRRDPNVYVGWLARTHRYGSADPELATASTFAARLGRSGVSRPVGPAMISRLENGTATWTTDHLTAYEKTLGLPEGRLSGPAYRIFRLYRHDGVDPASLRRFGASDEQKAADVTDCVIGGDHVTAADWDLLSAYLVATGRKLGVRTWGVLIERLLLEICVCQGLDQEMRSEALVRICAADLGAGLSSEIAIAMMTQPGNPSSFEPLRIYQQIPQRAPGSWIVQALINPPDRWLLRELFATVATLVDTGRWQPTSQQFHRVRDECVQTARDQAVELEVRRTSMQLLRKLDKAPSRTLRLLKPGFNPELVYLAKPTTALDTQSARYQQAAVQLAAHVQSIGLAWQAKWTHGQDDVLGQVLTESLVGHDDETRSAHTTLVVNSGYVHALRRALAQRFAADPGNHDPVLLRASIRLFGKIAVGADDGRRLLTMIDSERINLDTRVQACWALVNAAPRMPASVPDTMLDICRRQPFGPQSVTALRAAVAACGRAGRMEPLRAMREDQSLPLPVRDECRWWTGLPPYIRHSAAPR